MNEQTGGLSNQNGEPVDNDRIPGKEARLEVAISGDFPIVGTPNGKKLVVGCIGDGEDPEALRVIGAGMTPEGLPMFDPAKPEILATDAVTNIKRSGAALQGLRRLPRVTLRSVFTFLNKKDPTYINRFLLFNSVAVGVGFLSWMSRWFIPNNSLQSIPHFDKASAVGMINVMNVLTTSIPEEQETLTNPKAYLRTLYRLWRKKEIARDNTIKTSRVLTGFAGLLASAYEIASLNSGSGDPFDILAYMIAAEGAHWTNKQLIRRFQEPRLETIKREIGKSINVQLHETLETIGFNNIDSLVSFMADHSIEDERKQEVSARMLRVYRGLLQSAKAVTRNNSEGIAATLGRDGEASKNYDLLVDRLAIGFLKAHIKNMLVDCADLGTEYWESVTTKAEKLKEKALYRYRISL